MRFPRPVWGADPPVGRRRTHHNPAWGNLRGALHPVRRSPIGAPVVHRSRSELVSTDVAARENAATRVRKTAFMTAQPIERTPALRRDRRRPRPADAAHGPTFTSLGVPAPLAAALTAAGVDEPFPIQAAVLPDALSGADILGRGQTGSGKTLAFCIPLVARLAGGHTSAGRPRGLVLVPTRELASQVQVVLQPLTRAADLRVATIFGGMPQRPQVKALHNRVDIVVACPGRLADLIDQGHCHLGDVEVSVVDEADPPEAPAPIVHHLLTVAPADRTAVAAALAGGGNRSLIFTRTKHGARKLARQLTAAHIPAAELHGNLTQPARERSLASFASGAVRVLVATDIAARGIHVDGIDLVIHADPPAEHKAYLHRSGRTGRAGATGVVVTLQTSAQAADVRALMRKARIVPLAATVRPGSALLRSIAGEPARPPAPQPRPAALAQAAAAPARLATGRGAAAASARYRGRRRR